MTKLKVHSTQYSNFFGNNQIHVPYGILTNIFYCRQFPEIRERFDFQKVHIVRESVYDDIQKSKDADIILCSCYCWNWEITNIYAKGVKELNPNCIVIFGGPEIPDYHKDFFEKYPHVDLVVHGEGELTLCDILNKIRNKEPLKDIPGIEDKNHKAIGRDRLSNLDVIPSVWSDELWELVDRDIGYNYIVTWETNRGCPFSCTFCDWGSSTKTKIRNFSYEKLAKEAEWFGANKMIYIDCADGNFGIFTERDHSIAKKLAEVKGATGFPTRINLTWVKTSSEKIIPIAKELADADMLRAISLSVQSFDPTTLKIIKRSNIKFDSFSNLIKVFDDNGLESYTEMIMGLPGETIESWKKNWETIASIYPPPSVLTWNCSVFTNAPMNDEEYKKLYGIKVFKSPMYLQHSSSKVEAVQEYEMMVNQVASLPEGGMNTIYSYNWMMLVFHAFGLSEHIARYFNKSHGISFTKFYESLYSYCESTDGTFAKELSLAKKHAEKGYAGLGWNHYDPTLGDITWPIDEASWLRLCRDKDSLHKELISFIKYFCSTNSIEFTSVIEDLVQFQINVNCSPSEISKVQFTNKYNWKDYIVESKELVEGSYVFSKNPPVTNPDPILWGYESIFYGRRKGSFKIKLKDLEEND